MAQINSAILCDFAQVRGNLLFLLSGGITRLGRPTLPASMGVVLALVIEVPYVELPLAHEVVVTVKQAATATEVARVVAAFQCGVDAADINPGESIYVPLTIPLHQVGLDAHGAYDVASSVDGALGPMLTCYVVSPAPG